MLPEAIGPAGGAPRCTAAARRPDSPARLREAAQQFESLLLAQMLKSMRAGDGWLGTGEDASASSAVEMAEEQFAQALARNGGLGLTQTIVAGLSSRTEVATPPPAEPAGAAADPGQPAAHIPLESDGLPPVYSGSRVAPPGVACRGPGQM
jgi:flagellar protein FlgJ